MASFAKIGVNNKVLSVVEVSDDSIKDSNGNVQEDLGIQYLETITGWPCWVRTHKSDPTIHGTKYAGNGDTWNEDEDRFETKRPKDKNGHICLSWTWDTTKLHWVPPIACPDEIKNCHTNWDEVNKVWTQCDIILLV